MFSRRFRSLEVRIDNVKSWLEAEDVMLRRRVAILEDLVKSMMEHLQLEEVRSPAVPARSSVRPKDTS